eukprot:TRINITY_DN303_c0_g1_i1.p1 TRINITY_DN303_c0_g1~~TRINITY_DN303_c0_g1_i1.p1  ORF type:complete len:505 (-),score=92.11 TRINITY_DN303_c0_g1_i1:72-1586(-)
MKTVHFLLLLAALCIGSACAKTVVIVQSNTTAQINAAISGLKAGDTLRFSAGTYTNVSLQVSVSGDSDDEITITSVAGQRAVIVADPDSSDYCVQLASGVKYVTFSNIEFRHTSGSTSIAAGVFFNSNVHDIEFDSVTFTDITGVAIQMHDKNNIYDIEIKDCEFASIGVGANVTANLGIAITAGARAAGAIVPVTNVHDIDIEHCIFHDLNGAVGGAIAFTNGVYDSSITDTIIWDCGKGFNVAANAIISIQPGLKAASSTSNNIIVHGNAILNSAVDGASTVAIYISGGVDVVNNLIFDCDVGIQFSLLTVLSLKNTRCAFNTVFKVSGTAMIGLFTGLEDDTFIVANNVYYVGDTIGALIAYSWSSITQFANATVRNNYYRGRTLAGQVFSTTSKAMINLNGNATAYFDDGDVAAIGGGASFVVKGTLLNAGIDVDIDFDFYNNKRDESKPDCGAFESSGDNPPVKYGFKAANSGDGDGDGDGDGGSAANAIYPSALFNLF